MRPGSSIPFQDVWSPRVSSFCVSPGPASLQVRWAVRWFVTLCLVSLQDGPVRCGLAHTAGGVRPSAMLLAKVKVLSSCSWEVVPKELRVRTWAAFLPALVWARTVYCQIS